VIARVLTFLSLFWLAVACLAEADGPDAWQVRGVDKSHFLNIRKGPSTGFTIIGRVPHDAQKLENLGCFPEFTAADWQSFTPEERHLASQIRWCRIRFHGQTGWVFGKYLTEYQG